MRKIEIAKNLGSCKSAVAALMLAGVIIFLLPGLSKSEGGYELIWGEVGISGESSGDGYTQEGSVLVTDGNEMSGAGYTMVEESVVVSDDCIVSFSDFARFAEQWLKTGPDLAADLYEDEDNIVNLRDLKVFVDEWLHYCPYGWQLR